MNVAFEEILAGARTLPNSEKEELARILFAEVECDPYGEVEELWIAEARRRYALYQEGKMEAFDGDEVMARLRSRFE